MSFKFSFEKLLEHYKRQEDIARRDYLESLNHLDQQKNLYKKLYESLDEAVDETFRLRDNKEGTSIDKLVQLDNYIDGQKVRIARQREVIINHTSIVEQKQEILIAAAKEKQILDKLKEKKQTEFIKAEKKKEAKLTDELVVTRFRAGDRG